jgi:hypothetical protein
MLRLIALLALVSSPGLALAVDPPPADPEVRDVPSTFRSDSSGQLPPRVKASGEVFRTISWSDDKGDNLAIFSTDEKSRTKGAVTLNSKSIFVDLYAGKNGRLRKLRTVRESIDNCSHDLMNEFLDGAVGLTDLDRDGLGELIFAYRAACRSEMTPAYMKLLVLEGPHKYALEGKTRLHATRDQTVGGDFESRFDGAPPEFFELAKKVWNKFVAE